MLRALTLAAAIAFAPTAFAQQPAATECAAMDAKLGEFTAWAQKAATPSAAKAADLGKARLAIGKAYAAELHSTPDVKFAAAPEKEGPPASKAGMFEFEVKEFGTYGVALGSGAWIDVVKDSKVQTSTSHGHGPDCTTIRKVVNFQLPPGRYVAQVASAPDTKIAIMVLKR